MVKHSPKGGVGGTEDTPPTSASADCSAAHPYRPVTMRDGSKACGDCHATEGHPVHHVGDISILDMYGSNTGLIWFEENGEIEMWAVGAHETKDTKHTLRAHLAKFRPRATFLDAAVK